MKAKYFVVIGILAVGLLGYMLISLMVPDTRDLPQVQKNYAAAEAIRILGPEAHLLVQATDIDNDRQRESVAYLYPLQRKQQDSMVYAREFYVLKHTRTKTYKVIQAKAEGIYDENGAALMKAKARHGYLMYADTSVQHKPVFVFYLADSLGQPASDALPIAWNADKFRYLPMTP